VARSRSGTRGRRGPRKPPRRIDGAQSAVQTIDPRERGAIELPSTITVKELAELLAVNPADVIRELIKSGIFATINQLIDRDTASLVAGELGYEVAETVAATAGVSVEGEEAEAPAPAAKEVLFDGDDPADLTTRAPIVTVMGHVDHGKTSLLDAIRTTEVAAGERGGITQHIGASEVVHDGKRVVFLDTPGHEAFTAMRARGAKVTDIAVLVVAADDGVMPQTKDSISHARAAEVPIVVAINKIDVSDANADRVKTELASEGLQPEDWGGATQFAAVSAKQQTGLDELLEKILLVADAELDLRANAKADASGPIIESRLDVGRGPVATMLVQRGTLRVGDAIVAGDAAGKVRALYDYRGERVKEAGPGEPVEILGFDHPPVAGELSRVVEHERQAKDLAEKRSERLRREQLAQRSATSGLSLETLFEQMQAGAVQELNIVLKGDVQGSVEALVGELGKIQHPEVRVNVIHTGVGGITENDVNLASAANALVIGFNVRPSAEARQLAEREGVDIRTYRVIYKLTEDIEQALVGMLSPVTTEEVLGEAEVRALFKVSRLGTIAGCMVTNGVVRRGAHVRVVRDGTVVQDTSIAQLKRFKEDAREVAEGFECGILLDGFNDVKEGDVLEVFETREVERTELAPSGAAAAE
jgi:translation initiation factor IF-2